MTQLASPIDTALPSTNGTRTPAAPVRPVIVTSYGLTDRGRKRSTNEDQFVTATLMRALWIEQSSVPQTTVRYADDRGHLFVVADGMGGAAGGEKASAIAVGAVEDFLLNALRWLISLDGSQDAHVLREFKAAVQNADACVYAAAANNPSLRGMGTTLTMAYTRDADLFVAHVGDSRCYLLRGTKLERLTRDDTLVQELLESGVIPPGEETSHEARHIITNVVGGPTSGLQVEVHRLRLEPRDALLLCTDGLTTMLEDVRISAILQTCVGPQDACEQLIRAANDQGGDDNITAVVARYS